MNTPTQNQKSLTELANALRRNGDGKPEGQPVAPASPEELAVAHGIANYQRAISDRDDLQRKLDAAEKMIAVHKIEIEELRAQKASAESRITSYQMERDDAISNLAVYETLFISINSLMRTFNIENAPHVRSLKKEGM